MKKSLKSEIDKEAIISLVGLAQRLEMDREILLKILITEQKEEALNNETILYFDKAEGGPVEIEVLMTVRGAKRLLDSVYCTWELATEDEFKKGMGFIKEIRKSLKACTDYSEFLEHFTRAVESDDIVYGSN